MSAFNPTPVARPRFSEALRFWWKLGWISFGGTAAHIALMHDDLVEKKRWITNEAFLHALSLCMLLPGPEAQQLATYLGWKLHGRIGGVVAGVLFILPSMFVLLALSVGYVRFGSLPWVAAMFAGLKPSVVALVLLAISRVAARALNTSLQWIVCAGAFVSLTFLHVSLPLMMIAVIALGLFVARGASAAKPLRDLKEVHDRESTALRVIPRVIRIFALGLIVWFIPLLGLLLLFPDASFWKQLCFFFTRTAFVTIGGSYTVIPYVAHVAVGQFHWLGQSQMADGFALAETTPGPLIIVVAFVGFMAGFNHFQHSITFGIAALIVTTFYTFLPCFLFVFAGAPFVERAYGKPKIEMILRLMSALVIAAMADLAIFLLRGVLLPRGGFSLRGADTLALVWTVIAFLLLRVAKLNVGTLIALSLFSGLARWAI